MHTPRGHGTLARCRTCDCPGVGRGQGWPSPRCLALGVFLGAVRSHLHFRKSSLGCASEAEAGRPLGWLPCFKCGDKGHELEPRHRVSWGPRRDMKVRGFSIRTPAVGATCAGADQSGGVRSAPMHRCPGTFGPGRAAEGLGPGPAQGWPVGAAVERPCLPTGPGNLPAHLGDGQMLASPR